MIQITLRQSSSAGAIITLSHEACTVGNPCSHG
ncbi:conserved hypothetical protein, partial [Trichinella spiralis]